MCGIAGGYVSVGAARAAIAAIKHRGPDALDVIQVGPLALAHARLAIVDLDSRSNQPFRYGSTVISFNGEIWNHAALRKTLEKKGREFKTSGDTEVLAASLDEWGTGALSRINGMFSVAWTSDGGGTLFLARDRFGEIPIHFSTNPFFFASERKAFATREVYAVPPGCYVEMRAGERISEIKTYYDAPAAWNGVWNEGNAPARLKALLSTGARERAMADVPVCCLLSGGVDSSAIAACLLPHVQELVAYTAVLDERSRDLRCARSVAEMLGIKLVEVKVPVPSAADLREVIRSIEMPYKAQVEIGWPCLWLARAMRSDGFKVTFSGEGSDELWASYGFSYHALAAGADWHEYRKNLFLIQAVKNFPRCNKIFMSQGVECRLPFLHPSFVEFALSLSKRVVQMEGSPKGVIQAAFRGALPDDVLRRPKEAFQDGMGLKKKISASIKDPRALYAAEYARAYGKRTLFG